MGNSILTLHQSQLVEYAQKNDEITRWYFFTGGTALSEVYLHHRYSEDLDFFTRSQVNDAKIDAFFEPILKTLGAVKLDKNKISGLFVYTLFYDDGTKLKIDFNEYDFPQVERSTRWGNIEVDSLYDITINKLYTILSRTRARDFIDLYYCLDTVGCDIEMVLRRIPDKFPVSYQDISIGNQLAAVVDATDYPSMLVPFDRQKMIEFYLAQAKKFGERIFK